MTLKSRTLLLLALAASVLGTAASGQEQKQKTFQQPDAAVGALLKACEKGSTDDDLFALFGSRHKTLVTGSDPMARADFARAAREKMTLRKDGADRIVLVVGEEAWPLPIPLVKEGGSWRWDTDAGAEELINRRIGRNELNVIAVCRAYVAAQTEYEERDRDGDRVREFAQRVGSTPGKRDGLYWKPDPGPSAEESPLGALVAAAGRRPGENPEPFYGYRFRILTRQGDHAPGGAHNYIINGNMIAGFALIAYPAERGSTGIMSFLVSREGVVYEKDLGASTAEVVSYITAYDPDDTWVKVGEDTK